MTKFIICLLVTFAFISCDRISISNPSEEELLTPFEKNENYSAAYDEGIDYFKKLDQAFTKLKVIEIGETDIGRPLHLAILSKKYEFSIDELVASNKPLLFINNAIHPGEPCGVDATMILYRDILTNDSLRTWLDHINIVAIPYYNVGGALNRNSTTRANQNGPDAYGFRGNAKNLDLNRDFIKADSKNAQTFNKVFSRLKPEVFVDNHTTNGADYRDAITLINTVPEKMEMALAGVLKNTFIPQLLEDMENRGWPVSPYVFQMGSTVKDGIMAFNDGPRFSSGYAALHGSWSFISETHMLKPFKDRVWSNYHLMQSIIGVMVYNKDLLATARSESVKKTYANTPYHLNWRLDTIANSITFRGFDTIRYVSEVTGLPAFKYDRSKPKDLLIPYFGKYVPADTIITPKAYLIPQAYSKVIERLEMNGVVMKRLGQDSIIQIEQYFIEDFDTGPNAYENHYLHNNIATRTEVTDRQFYAGDYLVNLGQEADRYIIETLEPTASDSFFAWNFFDGILMQKEYFSTYLFEETALKMIQQDTTLIAELDSLRQADENFAKSQFAQLYHLYKKSPHYEKTHLRYPVGRIMEFNARGNHDGLVTF